MFLSSVDTLSFKKVTKDTAKANTEQLEIAKLITITGLKIGHSEDVTIKFHSEAKPSSLIWIVGDRKIYYGAKASKYISREIIALKNGEWNATLHILNVTHQDTLLSYALQVKNNLGTANYPIQIEGMYIFIKAFQFTGMISIYS